MNRSGGCDWGQVGGMSELPRRLLLRSYTEITDEDVPTWRSVGQGTTTPAADLSHGCGSPLTEPQSCTMLLLAGLWLGVCFSQVSTRITDIEQSDDSSDDLMVLPPWPAPKTSLKLIFFDDFNFLDKTKWSFFASASQGGHHEFEIYTPDVTNCYVRDSQMFLRPTLTVDTFGEDFLYHGVLNVTKRWGYCNPNFDNGCFRNASVDGIMPPVLSCGMNSKFYFKYGKAEIIAKMPRGDWLWPALWFMPEFAVFGSWPRSGEIDLAELLGNMRYGNIGVQRTTASLHFGNDRPDDTHLTNQIWLKNGTYADDFHKWTLDWTPSYINLYIDDVLVLGTPMPADGFHHHYHKSGPNIWGNSHNAPFDQSFYIIMNVAVGGTGGIFPDGLPNYPYPKPWSNNDTSRVAMDKFWKHKDDWYSSTWHGEDAAMKVQSVSVWSY